MGVLLAGCGQSSPTSSPPDPEVSSPAATGTQERPLPAPGSPAVFRFDSSVTPGILDSIEETLRYARADLGDAGPLVVHVYGTTDAFVGAHDVRAQEQARKDVEGGGYAFAGDGTIWIYAPTYARKQTNTRRLTLLHEYFHTVQASLAGPRGARAPLWLVEGSARYFEVRAGADRGYTYFDKEKQSEAVTLKTLGPLSSYETAGGATSRGGHGEAYTAGFVASDFLVQAKGVDALKRDFWTLLASTPDWHAAFASAFGMSVDDFYASFEANRPRL
jgi:hypothetical protein